MYIYTLYEHYICTEVDLVLKCLMPLYLAT